MLNRNQVMQPHLNACTVHVLSCDETIHCTLPTPLSKQTSGLLLLHSSVLLTFILMTLMYTVLKKNMAH